MAVVEPEADIDDARIPAGSPDLRRLNVAMVAAGLSAFSLLYATQALLPDVGKTFGVGATAASLTVTVTTGVLALTVLPVSALAERVGRTKVMAAGLGLACVAVLAGSASPVFWILLVLRGIDGLALAAVVAVAIGHIGDEVEPAASGAAIGVYVSGTSVGGLIGRLVPAGVGDLASWRWSMVALAAVGACGTLLFTRLAPPARPRSAAAVTTPTRVAIAGHLRDPGIVRLCAVGLLLMGGFVGTYNYLTYRLAGRPFDLPTSTVGLVFLAYLAGTVSSTIGARLAARHGRLPVVLVSVVTALAGLALTLSNDLAAVLVGLVVFTTGFFGAHAVASGWMSARAATHKSHASALYLMAYYLGSSVGGTLIGLAWTGGAWPATVTAVGGCYVLAGFLAAGIRSVVDPRTAQPRTAASTA